MAETTAREAKLIQYLNEAYTKEQELVTALTAHIEMTTRPPYKKKLQEHLRETKAQAKGLERRIKKLGGSPNTVAAVAKKATAVAKSPLHAVRGKGEAEKMLKNAKTQFFNEAEEIATYVGIEHLAKALGDGDTEKLAKEYRRQEERMQKFLERIIPQLTKAVVTEEIPAKERKPSANGAGARRRTAAKPAARTSTAKAASTAKKPAARKTAAAGKTTARKTTAAKPAARKTTARKPAARKTTARKPAAARTRRTSS